MKSLIIEVADCCLEFKGTNKNNVRVCVCSRLRFTPNGYDCTFINERVSGKFGVKGKCQDMFVEVKK